MYIDSLTYLSQAIDAAFEAAFVPAVLVAAVLVVAAGVELRAHVRRRLRPAAAKSGTARQQTAVTRARGAAA
jgi:hypothetical protein